jgi:hypothetical protein
MTRHPNRRGAVEATILMVLSALLVIGVFSTLFRRIDTTRHAARLELRAELETELESALAEAWWHVCRATAGDGTVTAGALRSRVIAALETRTASASTPAEPVKLSLPQDPKTLTIDAPTLHVVAVSGDAATIALRASGRLRRGGVEVAVRMGHRRAVTIHSFEVRGPDGETFTENTVHIDPEIVETEVNE